VSLLLSNWMSAIVTFIVLYHFNHSGCNLTNILSYLEYNKHNKYNMRSEWHNSIAMIQTLDYVGSQQNGSVFMTRQRSTRQIPLHLQRKQIPTSHSKVCKQMLSHIQQTLNWNSISIMQLNSKLKQEINWLIQQTVNNYKLLSYYFTCLYSLKTCKHYYCYY